MNRIDVESVDQVRFVLEFEYYLDHDGNDYPDIREAITDVVKRAEAVYG